MYVHVNILYNLGIVHTVHAVGKASTITSTLLPSTSWHLPQLTSTKTHFNLERRGEDEG